MIREPDPQKDSIQEDIEAALQRLEWGGATKADLQLLSFFGVELQGKQSENQREH